MRAIDFPYEITPRNMILRQETQNVSIFASIHTPISLNQGQGSIFTLRECAQSIFRIILPLYRPFWQKNFQSRRIIIKIPNKNIKNRNKKLKSKSRYIPMDTEPGLWLKIIG